MPYPLPAKSAGEIGSIGIAEIERQQIFYWRTPCPESAGNNVPRRLPALLEYSSEVSSLLTWAGQSPHIFDLHHSLPAMVAPSDRPLSSAMASGVCWSFEDQWSFSVALLPDFRIAG
jgi:hypothetical protein